MSFIQRFVVNVTTDGSGDATVYSPVLTGKLSQIRYVKDGTTPFTDGVDFTITAEATGETLWSESNVNASATRAPRQATHGTDGVASLHAAGGTAVQDKIALAKDRVKIVVAQGGSAKLGAFHIVIE